jgi:hypothetical protein
MGIAKANVCQGDARSFRFETISSGQREEEKRREERRVTGRREDGKARGEGRLPFASPISSEQQFPF